MPDRLRRLWFPAALVAGLGVGLWAPEAGQWLRDSGAVKGLVAAVMAASGLTLRTGDIVSQLRNGRAVIGSLVAVYALFPALAMALAVAVGGLGLGAPGLDVGWAILAAQASTLATAIVLTDLSGGNRALALVLSVVSQLASALLTPALLALTVGAAVQIDLFGLALSVLLVILVPVAIGQLARRAIGEQRADRWKPQLSVWTQLVIVVFAMTAAAAARERLLGEPVLLLVVVLGALLLHGVMLGLVWLAGSLMLRDPRQRVALLLCGTQKTLPASLFIWAQYFPTVALGPLPPVLYHLVQTLVDTALVPVLRRVTARGPGAPEAHDDLAGQRRASPGVVHTDGGDCSRRDSSVASGRSSGRCE